MNEVKMLKWILFNELVKLVQHVLPITEQNTVLRNSPNKKNERQMLIMKYYCHQQKLSSKSKMQCYQLYFQASTVKLNRCKELYIIPVIDFHKEMETKKNMFQTFIGVRDFFVNVRNF